jgi:AraC family transcriptional regulator, regulatory protein of adaptative response / DNA-3-methyladenine glycosylase II
LSKGFTRQIDRTHLSAGSPTGNLQLDPAFCWQAVYSRDHRFDGRFFAGIATTGIYCRSICPVSFGHPDSVQWFQSAASAEAAGFRPCRRCRPDTLPGSSAWFGTWAVVSRALKLISEGALDGGNLEQLAERVGIGSRHLRRLFQQHLGASPLKIARSHRVLVAKNLIVETQLPAAAIARATGFRSIRQFNHSVRTAFGQSPTALRRLHGTAALHDPLAGIVVHLPYRPPFDWLSLIQFLKLHATGGVESVEDGIYRRTVEIGGIAGAIEVWHEASHSRLSMRVLLPGCDRLMQAVQRVRRLFDLGADTLHIESYLARDARIARIVLERPGLRVPGAWDGFELAVLAILGQDLTADDSAPVIRELVKIFGRPLSVPMPGLTHLFPKPEALAETDLESIGISEQRAHAIRAVSRAVLSGALAFDSAKGANNSALQLRCLQELGEETAAYIAMRALGDPDAFSCTSLAFRNAMASHRSPVAPEEVLQIFEAYRPWRAYAAMHFWTSKQQATSRFGPPSAARNSNAGSIRRRSRASRRPRFRS